MELINTIKAISNQDQVGFAYSLAPTTLCMVLLAHSEEIYLPIRRKMVAHNVTIASRTLLVGHILVRWAP